MDPVVLNNIKKAVQESNRHAVSNASKIQKFRILPEDFSIGGGELGPTLKLKRRVVMEKYRDIIDEMYDDPNAPPRPPPQAPAEPLTHAPLPSSRPSSEANSEERLIAAHLDELSIHLEKERSLAGLPDYRSRTSSNLSDTNLPPYPPIQVIN
eukprot:sb/3473374/